MEYQKTSLTKKRTFKKLVISPHVDDEVLGCCSILDKDTLVYFCGINENKVNVKDDLHRIPLKERVNELKKVSEFMRFEWIINLKNEVNHYKEIELISDFENVINEIKPEKIFIPLPSYNQDHRAVYGAIRIALRPHDKNHFVKKVLTYEQPQAVLWNNKEIKVNYFVSLDIEKKIKAYSLHKSQIRPMRSFNLLKSLAKIRGKQSGNEFAEAFMIERWVD